MLFNDSSAYQDDLDTAATHTALQWVWALNDLDLRSLIEEELGDRFAEFTGYQQDLRHLAMHLVLAAPCGPPRSPREFLRFCTPAQLASNWSGKYDADPKTSGPWTGPEGTDLLIHAVTTGRPSPVDLLAVEFANQVRCWVANPWSVAHQAERIGVTPDH